MKLNISAALVRSGMTQSALADAVGIGKGFLSEIISGKKDPSFETFKRIAKVLEIDTGEAFDDWPRVTAEAEARRRLENELVLRFRSLPPERQQAWLDLATMLASGPAPQDQ
ncbi:MAG: helix-turn-helix transcriptional regulator [Deltaproteobacteria bacterium]